MKDTSISKKINKTINADRLYMKTNIVLKKKTNNYKINQCQKFLVGKHLSALIGTWKAMVNKILGTKAVYV